MLVAARQLRHLHLILQFAHPCRVAVSLGARRLQILLGDAAGVVLRLVALALRRRFLRRRLGLKQLRVDHRHFRRPLAGLEILQLRLCRRELLLGLALPRLFLHRLQHEQRRVRRHLLAARDRQMIEPPGLRRGQVDKLALDITLERILLLWRAAAGDEQAGEQGRHAAQ